MRQPLLLLLSACARSRHPPTKLRGYGVSRRLSSQRSKGDPLRILYCGSDAFSTVSLRALHEYSLKPESDILSIDVVTKTDKRTGRGLKVLKPPAIKSAALELGLPLHQIDTFTGWSPPEYGSGSINLIVAVSFGRLIPPRILASSKYNGLNVHPSLLPDLPGAAPIQWTIIDGRRTTGITLQTLHPSRFDEGIILDQTPPPGITIPNRDSITTKELTALLAPLGADMLVNALRDRLYGPPYRPVPTESSTGTGITHAPKITPQMCAVDFSAYTRDGILRRNRAIGPLHALARDSTDSQRVIRVKFGTDMRSSTTEDIPGEMVAKVKSIPEGVPYALLDPGETIDQSSKPLIINALASSNESDRRVTVPTITVSSMKSGPAVAAAARAGFFGPPVVSGRHHLYCFAHPLTVPVPSEG
jgi:methionyl-tRNA formyltransferase